ncbi:MAG: hypothetical protein ACRBFS_04015 [Aureispira sp.]
MKYLLSLLIATCSLTACHKEPTPTPEPAPATSLVRSDKGDFMPFELGSTWTYLFHTYDTLSGVPNANHSTTVHTYLGGYVMDNKEYFDLNGALIHFKEGIYYKYLNNQNGVAPIMIEDPVVGDTWKDTTIVDPYGMFPLIHTYTITATGQHLTVPAGTFNDVVVLEVNSRGYQTATDEWHYYKKGIGLLQQRINYRHFPKRVLMELDSYSIL